MAVTQGAQQLLPWWLQRTAERVQSQVQLPDHMTVRRETCRVETQDGFKVLKCEEIREVFRCAADGQREIVEKSESTSVRPFEQGNMTSRYDDVADGPLAPIVSATLGQMLDDFFQYAAELQQSLEQQDPEYSGRPNWINRSSSSRGNLDGFSRLCNWWQRRKPATAAAVSAGHDQPSLQQLVRESSSTIQEI